MSGVGTELSKLIPEWASQFRGGCGCKNTAKKWDSYGIDWCERNKELMVDHLVGQAKYLHSILKMLPSAAHRAGAAILVDKAIKKAREVAKDGED